MFLCSCLFQHQRLVVCLEESIYIHNIKDMKLLKTLLNTPTNPSGRLQLLEEIKALPAETWQKKPQLLERQPDVAKLFCGLEDTEALIIVQHL